MYSRYREIWWAAAAAVVVTAAYGAAWMQHRAFPTASGVVGHGIGILGFVLMLGAETLYSLRKRSTRAAWGPMVAWLRAHIFLGLVGPYMVLLHTAMRFGGAAGLAMLVTGIVVLSGVVGRYIYTSLPREVELAGPPPAARRDRSESRAGRLASQRGALATWYAFHVPLTLVLFALAAVHMAAALYYATLQR